MQPRVLSAGLTAALVTLLSMSCLGVLFAGLDFFVVEWLERALEGVGILPDGWGHSHLTALIVATAITALPPLLYLGVILFRHSYRVEMALGDGGLAGAPPPT